MIKPLTTVLFFLTCTKSSKLCEVPNFQDVWWQLHFSDAPYGDCYSFLEGGQIITSDGYTTWPNGQWTAESNNCYSTIITEDGYIDVYQDGDCLLAVLDNREYTVCECSYET